MHSYGCIVDIIMYLCVNISIFDSPSKNTYLCNRQNETLIIIDVELNRQYNYGWKSLMVCCVARYKAQNLWGNNSMKNGINFDK